MLQILTMRHIQAKFRHETEGLLPSSATQVKSHHSNILSYTHVHKNRLDAVAEVNVAKTATFTGKLQDGFTVLLMTETKFGIILTLKNNTNPFDLLGNCRSCQENWMNRGHEKTRLCLEHENKITFYLLFHCS